MKYSLDMDQETKFLISHLPPAPKKRIRESLQAIAAEPLVGKALQDDLQGFYSYRMGSLRIIYSIDEPKKKVNVVAIGPRRNVYEELEKSLAGRLLRKKL